MFLGLTIEKLLVIGAITAMLLGPERLPALARSGARLMARLGRVAREARTRIEDEAGMEISDEDWRKLDPRRYDPRRIVREALLDDDDR